MTSLAQHLDESYLRGQPNAAARSLETMSNRTLARVLAGVDPQVLVPVMEVMATSPVAAAFAALSGEQRTAVLEAASPRLALLILERMGPRERTSLFAQLPDAIQKDLRRLQQYPENTAGRLMDAPFETIRPDTTVSEVLALLHQSTLRGARTLYVVDHANQLAGRVDMQDLALADATQKLDDIMIDVEGKVFVTAGREEIVDQMERQRVDSVPVVDLEGRLVGVVRYQRLFEAVENVASADVQKMVGAGAEEKALSGATFAVKRRLPWLHINLLTAFLAAAVVGMFENLIAQFTALAVLLPVVAGQSGNAGSQALAVTMRGLALREIGTREWRRVLFKEIRIGAVDGLALAVTCGLGVFLWSRSFGLALVIGVAMVTSMIAAGISGALVPIVLTRVGQDPATASSIILTTVTDVAGFLSFLGTATVLSFML